jgi:hypothetical protein
MHMIASGGGIGAMTNFGTTFIGRATNLAAIWKTFVRRNVIDNVPNEMAACLDCDEVECSGDRYDHCAVRLATADALETFRDVTNPPKIVTDNGSQTAAAPADRTPTERQNVAARSSNESD